MSSYFTNLKVKKTGPKEWQIIDTKSGERAPWTSSFKSYSSAKANLDKILEAVEANRAWLS